MLIDFENIAISLRDSKSTLPLDLRPVVEKANSLSPGSRAGVMRAYADWRHFSEQADQVVRLGISPRQSPSFRYQGKNATDVQMAIEATDLMHLHPELKTFILVTGDSDFTPLVHLLHERGRKVIGIGVSGSVSRQLMQVCDDFLLYDTLFKKPAPSKVQVREAVRTSSTSKAGYEQDRSKTTEGRSAITSSRSNGNGRSGGDQSESMLQSMRTIVGLDPNEPLTSRQIKNLLPLAVEAWTQTHPTYRPEMRRALRHRFPNQFTTHEAASTASVLEKTGGLGDSSWLEAGGGDSELLFDLWLHTSHQRLQDVKGERVDPGWFGKIVLKDSVEPSELRMRILRGKTTLEKRQQN